MFPSGKLKYGSREKSHILNTLSHTSRIIEMAWEDRTPFEAIAQQFGLNETEVIKLMRRELKRASFKLWRERVSGRHTKHLALRPVSMAHEYRHAARLGSR